MHSLTGPGGGIDVLAHASDPVAVLGFFGPALVLVAIVVTAVVRDRRRHGRDDDEHSEPADGVSRPPAG